jgi:hypothetical protein
MTEAELEILAASAEKPNVFFDYFFRKKGQPRGWQLDHNFTEEGKWQEEMCMASQSFIVTIAGISTGKTLGTVMSAAYHATLTRSFKFLNVAARGWQSKLMHRVLLEQAKDTPFEELIISSPTRPYPVITIAYRVGDQTFESSLEFLSLGEKGDATNIFSWRGDWLNIEEAGLIDLLNEVIGNLVTRLTGVTAEGRPFLARLSLISNPWDNPELWAMYDMAAVDKEDGLVFNIDTKDNRNTTEKQVKLALKRIPVENHEKFMTGKRPQGRGGFFTTTDVEACESQELADSFLAAFRTKTPGYVLEQNPVMGVWHFRTPRRSGHTYYVVGDPGTGAAPARNAPTIVVFDTTDAPKFCPMVAMWWGNGHGQIMPFVGKLLEWTEYYAPQRTIVDNTGTQKNSAELINYDHVYGKQLSIARVEGMDFASTRKMTYLLSLQLSVETAHMMWPKFLYKNVSSQLANYDYEKDKSTSSKLPQDIVACLAMVSIAVREKYGSGHQENGEEVNQDDRADPRDRRSARDSFAWRRDPRRQDQHSVN